MIMVHVSGDVDTMKILRRVLKVEDVIGSCVWVTGRCIRRFWRRRRSVWNDWLLHKERSCTCWMGYQWKNVFQ